MHRIFNAGFNKKGLLLTFNLIDPRFLLLVESQTMTPNVGPVSAERIDPTGRVRLEPRSHLGGITTPGQSC